MYTWLNTFDTWCFILFFLSPNAGDVCTMYVTGSLTCFSCREAAIVNEIWTKTELNNYSVSSIGKGFEIQRCFMEVVA